MSKTSAFQQAIETVEALSTEEQIMLVEIMQNHLQEQDVETSAISSDSKINKPIWEIAQNLLEDLTEDEKSELPKDGAEQHDHYIYGTPKTNR
jgi:hypothetical protein